MNYLIIFIVSYLIVMNFAAFILYYADKRKAVKHKWRIPESTLLAAAFAGGSFGAYFAMKIFRHKTKHLKFRIPVPLMMIFHAVLIVFAFSRLM